MRGTVPNSCALCLQERALCKSHIIPEFLYQSLYNKFHRFLIMSTDPEERNVTRPKGIYERLLCQECENRIRDYEIYASDALYEGAELKGQKTSEGFLVENIDYTRFKLFQMTLIWRVGACTRGEMNDIRLGPHQERLRAMIYDGNPGKPYEYGCCITATTAYREILGQSILPPMRMRKVDGHACYMMVIGGMFWHFFVSSHTKTFPLAEYFISEKGTIHIRVDDENTTRCLAELVRDLKAAGKLAE